MENLIAWHGDADLKARTVEQMRKDREFDAFVQGLYLRLDDERATGFQGCALGCLVAAESMKAVTAAGHQVQSSEEAIEQLAYNDFGWHDKAQQLYGLPRAVSYLIDRVFEGQSPEACATFAVESIEAIPVGADLSLVSSRFLLDILTDPDHGVLQYAEDEYGTRAAVQSVVALYERRLAGDEPTQDEWRASAYASADAAYAAEWRASADAAAYAAYAADAAAYAAYAADAAYADYAASVASAASARADFWQWAAQRLIHHLSTAPIAAMSQ